MSAAGRSTGPGARRWDVLTAVRVDDAYANLVLPQVLRKPGSTAATPRSPPSWPSGTIRGAGALRPDHRRLPRPSRCSRRSVRDVLRLGGPPAALHAGARPRRDLTSVDLVRAKRGRGRPASSTPCSARSAGATSTHGSPRSRPTARPTVGHLAVAHSPTRAGWSRRSREALGRRGDELDALLAADNAPPRVTLVARPGLCRPSRSSRPPAAPAPPVAVRRDPARVATRPAVPAVAEGRAGVQDEGSQLVALALADAPLDGRDERWLDLCAGPGGKAALLAALAASAVPGSSPTSGSPTGPRWSRPRCARPPGSARCSPATAPTRRGAPGTFDRVLVDAPCSGLGALRRRPESRWRRTPERRRALVAAPAACCSTSALDSVRPGGVVVYATCSPVVAETSDVVRACSRRRGDTDEVGPLPAVAAPRRHGRDVRGHPASRTGQSSWPHRHGTDAMFIDARPYQDDRTEGGAPEGCAVQRRVRTSVPLSFGHWPH